VTSAQLFVPSKKPGELEALAMSADPLRLRCSGQPGISHVSLIVGHQFRVVPDEDSGWHVSTSQYEYYIQDDDERELIAWHWHPESTITYPHLHVPAGPIHHKTHVPTGRVSIEAVIRLLITEYGVPPIRDDWAAVLEDAEANFIRHRRWSGTATARQPAKADTP
jgi:hypothetical protein